MKTGKRWGIGFLLTTLALLIGLGLSTVIVDPYFHYHAPLEGLSYQLVRERYINDGIVKHFPYDAIITGTSMTENFKTTEADELFHAHFVKVPFSGSRLKEISNMLESAFSANKQINMVISSLDCYMICRDKDEMRENTPEFMYDNNPFNDVQYVLNKKILFEDTLEVLCRTKEGTPMTSFDDYANWNKSHQFGVAAIQENTPRSAYTQKQAEKTLSEEELEMLYENMTQNVISIVKDNPEIAFYYFFPPYSIIWWEKAFYEGNLRRQIQIYEVASEMLLEYDNVHLFSFLDEYKVITDLDNYRDLEHYGQEINSKMLKDFADGNHELTRENYRQHWSEVLEYYDTFDYETFFSAYPEMTN